MGDPKTDQRKFSRRDFLKLAGVGFGVLTIPPWLLDKGLDIGLTATAKGMELQIPPEFVDVKIPERNENYREPENILLDAFDQYESWRRKNNLPRVHYEKGKEYLSFASLAEKFPRLFEKQEDEELNGWDYRLYGLIMASTEEETVNTADVPEIHGFSAFSQNGIVDHIFHNPGSKIITEAEKYVLEKYGWDRKQLISSIIRYDKNLPEVKPEDWDVATKIASKRLKDALSWFEQIREERGEPLSVSEVIAYFLYQNEGDLKTSMWDSTLLLKVLARNDVETLFSNNTMEKAEKLGYLFKDEFSPRISHNWLMEQFAQGVVPKESVLYLGGAMDNEPGKNFMPINKDGTYYHVMNLITWAAVAMEPWVVKSMVTAYYNEQNFGGIDHRTEHGIDKVNADIKASQSADRIKRVVEWET